jgi:hypothetical protein
MDLEVGLRLDDGTSVVRRAPESKTPDVIVALVSQPMLQVPQGFYVLAEGINSEVALRINI